MDTSKSGGWVMPDPDRCQCEWLGGSFMTLGPRSMVRCEEKPVVIATESTEGAKGAMSLCGKHLAELLRQDMRVTIWRKEE